MEYFKKLEDEVKSRSGVRNSQSSPLVPRALIWSVIAIVVLLALGGGSFYLWRVHELQQEEIRAQREVTEWRVAFQLNTVEAFEAYLKAYPAGRYAEDAARGITRVRNEIGRTVIDPALVQERSDWQKAELTGTKGGYRAFLEVWPNGRFAATANRLIREIDLREERQYWRETVAKATLQAYEAYLEKYPQGSFVSEAKKFLSDYGSARPLTLAEEEKLRGGSEFRECPNCPLVVVVPAGDFMMGSSKAEGDDPVTDDNERPVHAVKIRRPFGVGKFEVTFAEWDACVADGGCRGYKPGDKGWGRGKLPVMNVSWDDAKLYVRWLSSKTGKIYRLLSEAEWEYAARAGSTTRFYFGDDSKSLCKFANVADESGSADRRGSAGFSTWMVCSDGFYNTAPVGSFPSNAFRLHDMLGNVGEWVEDVWHDDYVGAPDDGRPRTSGADSQFRVGRGGSFYHLEGGVTSAVRAKYRASSQGELIGFRIGRTLGP